MTTCAECGRPWPSVDYAETCAENDRAERYDRDHGHLLHLNREA